jgi:cytochrome c2
MSYLTKATLALVASVALGLPAAAAAQGGGFTVDPAQATKGMSLWKKHGCYACHGFGRVLGGPDLAGVHERRSREWLQQWMTNTTAMLQSDSTAMALLAAAKGVKMPQIRLSEMEIDALIHYMAQETQKKRMGR